MATDIDFKRLSPDGSQFESLVCQLLEDMGFRILEQPASGPDGGRDILVERVLSDALGEKREKIVVQCKHYAHSGKAVTEKDLGVWHNTLIRYHAQGYLLVTSTTATESLNRVFIEFNKSGPQLAQFWNRDKIIQLLNVHINVRDQFFPPTITTFAGEFIEKGWGIIFPRSANEVIRKALKPLLELRKSQIPHGSGRGIYREFFADDGYRPHESASDFLARHGVGPGHPDLSRIPFFLTLIGDAQEIPFSFQAQLGIQYAVSRLTFDKIDDYRNYAQTVVRVEKGEGARSSDLTLIGIQHEDDPATELSSNALVSRLYADLSASSGPWAVRLIEKEAATKARLREILGGQEASRLIFVASHGISLPIEDSERRLHEGAIVTADWPGPITWRGPLTPEHYFGSDDVLDTGALMGSVVFLFGCATAGGSLNDTAPVLPRPDHAEVEDFVARLPKRLLGMPSGGALAVFGHVGRAWTSSFFWKEAGPQPQTIRAVLEALMSGQPVGVAMQILSRRHAELASLLTSMLGDQKRADDTSTDLASLWSATIDARNYILLGDPAVRLRT